MMQAISGSVSAPASAGSLVCAAELRMADAQEVRGRLSTLSEPIRQLLGTVLMTVSRILFAEYQLLRSSTDVGGLGGNAAGASTALTTSRMEKLESLRARARGLQMIVRSLEGIANKREIERTILRQVALMS